MRRSTKAALLSGLVFPGVGHMALKNYRRGAPLLLAALIALWVLVDTAVERALSVVDRINSGDVPLEVGAISQAVADSAISANPLLTEAPVIVFTVCWLIGIVDSYRLGGARDQPHETSD